MLLIEPISAITSWEDYEYQGHVALYIALKSILDLLQNGKSVSDYDLQIEGEEDFSIRKDCKYISLHQVKAGAIRLEQNDKFSFVIGILQNEAEYGYFHIANGKRIPVDFVSSTLTYISMLKNELKKKVIEKKDIADTDNEDKIKLDIDGNKAIETRTGTSNIWTIDKSKKSIIYKEDEENKKENLGFLFLLISYIMVKKNYSSSTFAFIGILPLPGHSRFVKIYLTLQSLPAFYFSLQLLS